jgi:malonyl-CoA/methylmalonyl-CoA synthetase
VYLPNRIEMIDVFLACVKLGAIVVPINILYRDREMAHILKDAEPKLLITETELSELLAEAHTDELRDSGGHFPDVHFPDLDGDAPAALVYTSGTTGASKGAILTHNNFAANATNLLTCWQITEHDRFLLTLPLFHVHGLGNGIHCWLMSGCRMRLLERFEHQTATTQFLDFKPTLKRRRAKSARACDCSYPDRLRLPRRCWRIFARDSGTPFSSDTA